MLDPVTNPLVRRLVENPKLEHFLKGLGLFLRDYRSGEFFPNTLWADLGYGPNVPEREEWTSYLHPDDRVPVIHRFQQVLKGDHDTFESEFRIKDAKGSWRWIRHHALVLERDEEMLPTLYAGVDQEVTHYKERLAVTEGALRQYEQKYWQTETLRAAGAIVSSELEPEKAVERILEQARNILPFNAAVVWSIDEGRLHWLGGHGLERREASAIEEMGGLFRTMLEEQRPVLMTDYCSKHPERFYCEEERFRGWLGVPLVYHGLVMGVMEFLTARPGTMKLDHLWSVSLLAEQIAIALANAYRFRTTEKEASTDPLTGLLTRRTFERLAARYWESKQESTAVLMLDLDHFKQVNDRWGHSAGDEALKRAALVVRSVLRERDLVCRWGGEEFAILLMGANQHSAIKAAERIREEMESVRLDSFSDLHLTTSIGLIVEAPDGHRSFADLIEMADLALYKAKREGRNRVRAFKRTKRAC